ncbi:glycosyltransferase family 2 protein [Sulfuricella denitrificans]|uniref:glycosyltransferase family 2 protein n=1 Tax=Sulfuricella denitrificans TaxID=649841 RepID=UPI00068719F6|nr:glycosyltransferase family 2 protein [Sulfuricella denitrificans]
MNTLATPLVSIITVVRNGASTIFDTVESVRAQQGVDVEHIIIDGASTDGTVGIINVNQYDRLRLISEPDQGIYDAMNKGISLAQGEWLLFLGADDVLADPAVLVDIFQNEDLTSYDLVCGTSNYHSGQECVPRLDWHTLIFNTVHHQAAFYRRRLFDDFRYRLDIPVVADYEMNFLIHFQSRPALFLDRRIAISGCYGVSHTSSQLYGQFDAYRIRGQYVNVLLNIVLLAAGLGNLLFARLMGRFPQRKRPYGHGNCCRKR